MPDLIFVSMEDWDGVWRRNQFVCDRLARRHPDCKILFVGLARDVSNSVRRGRISLSAGRATRRTPEHANIIVTHPPKLLPNSIPWFRLANEWMFRRHVLKVSRTMGLRRPVLWLNPHYAVHMVGRMRERAVVYDVTDDWTKFRQSAGATRLVEAQDRELCIRADTTIVCSQALYDGKRSQCRNIHLIANGVDAAHYRIVLEGVGPLPAETRHWERPILGYTGSIHPERVDVPLVEAIARRMNRGCIVMIGPCMLSKADEDRLRLTRRVRLVGIVPYAELPQHMRAFDACIVPHRLSPFTESLNPIKLWEYLAAGKPIISTPVAGFRDFPDLVYLASTAEEFQACLNRALQESPLLPERRRREAGRHSWDSRVDQVEKVLCSR